MTSHPLLYYDLMRQSKDSRFLRLRMVRFALEHGIKPAARAFATYPKTVRKWLRRYQEGGYQVLVDRSRAPKNPARRISDSQRQRALKLKRRLPSWGAQRMRDQFGLKISEKAIRKIWREAGLLKRKRRKHKTKQNLRAVKKLWNLFEQIDVDTKDLDDIPELWPQIQRHRLPTIQYTARDVVSGTHFIAYAYERSLDYSTFWIQQIIEHLENCSVDLQDCRIQTDNGSEFIGSWNAKDDSAFTQAVEAVPGLAHHTIPPGAHTWQSDVETAHRLIEDEFYEVEHFSGLTDFLHKAYTYNLWFNFARANSYKENQTPWQILTRRNPQLPKALPAFPVILLDHAWAQQQTTLQRGYDVIQYPYVCAQYCISRAIESRLTAERLCPLWDA